MQGLVHSVARKFDTTSTTDLEDLVQEGNIALMRAIELFDPERGAAFSTYAYRAIANACVGAVQHKGPSTAHAVDGRGWDGLAPRSC